MKKRLFRLIALVALLGVGLFAIATPVPTAHATPSGSTMVTRSFGPSAMASFIGEYTDTASGDPILVEVSVFISTQSIQQPPGKPTSGSTVGVSIIESNTVTGAQLNGAGNAPAPAGMTIDGKTLGSAFLPATEVQIGPTGDNPDAFTPYTVQVGAVSWTGVGAMSFSSQTIHFRIPQVLNGTAHMSGTSRMATAVANSFSYTSPLTGIAVTLTNPTNSPGPSSGLPTELDNGRSTVTVVLHAPISS